MPGYILHLTEAELILQELKEEGCSLSPEWINAFRLGTLLPDTRRKKEKITSHFWESGDLQLQAIAPSIPLFLQKYREEIKGPLMLGYLSHLDLDACFVNTFWPSMWEFLDADLQLETLQEKIRSVYLKKNGKTIPVTDFFSSAHYYGDYSRMNAYFLRKYRLQIPVLDSSLSCPITEVCTEDLKEVLAELQYLCSTMQPGTEKELTVFDLPSLESFIQETARQMAAVLIREYSIY